MSPVIQSKINKMHVGSTNQVELSRTEVLNTQIPVPPLNEQKRIVTKIEALQQRSNRAKNELEAIKPLLDKFRQSVLSAAFRGDLTQDWRENNSDIEPALSRWNIKISTLKFTNLPNIPLNWSYIKLQEISERVSVGHVGQTTQYYCDSSQGVPFLRSQNVRPGRLDLTGIVYITRNFHESLKKSQLLAGDLLIVRVGANRGDTCILPEGLGDVNCANIVFARPFSNISNYLNWYFQTKLCQTILENLTTGSAQGVINTKAVAEVPIPIPPKKEQTEIVRRIENLFKLADSIEQQYKQAQTQLETLNQSILVKAFRGELIPQNPNDEPASVLLERIKAEKAKQEQSKRTSKKTSKKQSQQLKLFE